ncbi:hypothetical protein VKT23_002800 [Stygiomarasmius scandens]|uniref:Uncharacterized protein n=1 Tax=Marasmiellus scandens TaxID=2682957 RepID=A0ABR1JZP5_9AGAR
MSRRTSFSLSEFSQLVSDALDFERDLALALPDHTCTLVQKRLPSPPVGHSPKVIRKIKSLLIRSNKAPSPPPLPIPKVSLLDNSADTLYVPYLPLASRHEMGFESLFCKEQESVCSSRSSRSAYPPTPPRSPSIRRSSSSSGHWRSSSCDAIITTAQEETDPFAKGRVQVVAQQPSPSSDSKSPRRASLQTRPPLPPPTCPLPSPPASPQSRSRDWTLNMPHTDSETESLLRKSKALPPRKRQLQKRRAPPVPPLPPAIPLPEIPGQQQGRVISRKPASAYPPSSYSSNSSASSCDSAQARSVAPSMRSISASVAPSVTTTSSAPSFTPSTAMSATLCSSYSTSSIHSSTSDIPLPLQHPSLSVTSTSTSLSSHRTVLDPERGLPVPVRSSRTDLNLAPTMQLSESVKAKLRARSAANTSKPTSAPPKIPLPPLPVSVSKTSSFTSSTSKIRRTDTIGIERPKKPSPLNPIPPLPPLPSSFPAMSASVTLSRSSSDPHPHGLHANVYGDAASRLKTKSDTHLPLSVSNFLALEEDAESVDVPVPSSSSSLCRKDSIKRNSPPSHAIRVPESPGTGRWSSFGSESEPSGPSLKTRMGMTWKEAMERRESEWEWEEDPTPMPSPTTPTLVSFSVSAAQSQSHGQVLAQGMVETAPLRVSPKSIKGATRKRCGTPMSGWLGKGEGLTLSSGRVGQNGLLARTMSSRVNLPRTEVYYADADADKEAFGLERRPTMTSQRSRNASANSEADSTYWTAKSCFHEE